MFNPKIAAAKGSNRMRFLSGVDSSFQSKGTLPASASTSAQETRIWIHWPWIAMVSNEISTAVMPSNADNRRIACAVRNRSHSQRNWCATATKTAVRQSRHKNSPVRNGIFSCVELSGTGYTIYAEGVLRDLKTAMRLQRPTRTRNVDSATAPVPPPFARNASECFPATRTSPLVSAQAQSDLPPAFESVLQTPCKAGLPASGAMLHLASSEVQVPDAPAVTTLQLSLQAPTGKNRTAQIANIGMAPILTIFVIILNNPLLGNLRG